jgi:hypothetical protein
LRIHHGFLRSNDDSCLHVKRDSRRKIIHILRQPPLEGEKILDARRAPGAYQKMSGLISDERFSLTLTLSR